jgi:ATP-dependent protease ClpP protease subunit
VPEVRLYDYIGPAEPFARELASVDAKRLIVRINSQGGSAFDGIAIHNAIARHSAQTTVYVDGLAASAASVIAMAGDEIIISKYGQMMIHDASGGVVGTAAEMTAFAKVLDDLSDSIASVYADRAGGDVQAWRDRMRGESWYRADAAVAAGLADRVDKSATPAEPDTNGASSLGDLDRVLAVASARRQRAHRQQIAR